jgi:predicted ATPase/transcriptional regulator with XRE-family HTH domain
MTSTEPVLPLESFATFGDLLKYLRKRARLTQRELAIAAGYSEAQISRLEQNLRPPDLSAVTALLIPALYVEDEPEVVSRLLELAAQARGEPISASGVVTFSHSVRQEVVENFQTVEDVVNNLPLQLTSFVGREREMEEIANLLEDGQVRLLTLTGSGGCGKTRLALELARQLGGKYRDGIWLIELASIEGAERLQQAVASALGLAPSRDDEQLHTLIKYLRAKKLLLIFDNCEQIVSLTATLAEEILRNCPRVQILATSREIFNMPGETRFPIPALSMPQGDAGEGKDISQFESVQLFVERARAVMPSFALTGDNATSIAQICRRVDGMPLAIELAAARITTLSAQQIAIRLENSFQLLAGGRKAVPRHETLQATIDWSYALLSEPEKALLSRLSVFAGGWTLEAAEAIADPSEENVLDLMSQLVNKSLVHVEFQATGNPRYHLLETIRHYSHQHLNESGKREETERRHFDFFLELAETAENGFKTSQHQAWLERLDREKENLRAAHVNSLAAQHYDDALQFTGTLFWYWQTLGYIREGRSQVGEALNQSAQGLSENQSAAARAKALWCAGALAWIQGDYAEADAYLKHSMSLRRNLGDKIGLAISLREVGIISTYRGELEEAHTHLKESIEILKEVGSQWELALAFYNQGLVYEADGETETARTNFVESQSIFRKLGEPWGLSVALFGLGLIAGRQADYAAAHAYLEESLELSHTLGDPWSIASALYLLGEVSRLEQDMGKARSYYVESLRLNQVVGDQAMIGFTLHNLGNIAWEEGRLDQAVQLFGAAKSLRKDSIVTTSWSLTDHAQCEQDIASLRAEFGNFDVSWRRGFAMSSDEGIEYALDVFRQ